MCGRLEEKWLVRGYSIDSSVNRRQQRQARLVSGNRQLMVQTFGGVGLRWSHG